MKHLLIIGGHDETFARFAGLPFRFSIIQLEPSIGAAQRRLTTRIETVAALAAEPVVELARQIHASDPVDLIFSFTEDGLLPAATAARELGVEGIDYDACLACIDKSVMREHFAGTPFALASRQCHTPNEALEFFETHPGGVVLKDPRGAGSRHVAVARSTAEVESLWQSLSGLIGPILVEEHIGGREYSVETLSIRGRHELIGITEKTLHADTLMEAQHVFPASSLDAATVEAIGAHALGVLEALGYRHGPCHIEVKVDASRVHLIEVNNRAGGDFIWELVWLTTGIDMFRETLACAFEGQPDPAARAAQAKYAVGASKFFFAPQDQQRVRASLGDTAVERWCLDDEPAVQPVLDSDDRIGPIVISGSTVEALRAALASVDALGHAAPAATPA